MLTGLLHYCTLLSKEFLLFSTIPISIETIMPIRTTIAVHLMISFAIHTFKDMRIWLTILSSRTSCFLVLYATFCFLSMVFGNMSSIVLQLRNLNVGLEEEPCIEFIQENSMENSLQELSLLIYVVTLVHAMTTLFLL